MRSRRTLRATFAREIGPSATRCEHHPSALPLRERGLRHRRARGGVCRLDYHIVDHHIAGLRLEIENGSLVRNGCRGCWPALPVIPATRRQRYGEDRRIEIVGLRATDGLTRRLPTCQVKFRTSQDTSKQSEVK